MFCLRSARRNLTRSFEEVAKQTSSISTSTLSESENEDKTWKRTGEDPVINEMELAPQVTMGNPLPSNKQPLGGVMEEQPLLMDHPSNVRPEARLPPQSVVGEEGRAEGVHHFCYAIDIRSVRNISQQRPLNVWLR